MLERVQRGIFSQLVVVPLFSDHHVLIQVAGHEMNVVRALPPLVLSEEDVDWFARGARRRGRPGAEDAVRDDPVRASGRQGGAEVEGDGLTR